jgi:hypothetical protein
MDEIVKNFQIEFDRKLRKVILKNSRRLYFSTSGLKHCLHRFKRIL